jgi:thymidylate kinase
VSRPGSWIGFEGIVASGKTTQSRLLAESIGLRPTDVVPEFGDHELGRYLSRFGSPGMRLTPEGSELSYVRHVLALSSHLQKLNDVGRTAASTVVLDVATLTDAAYALADLPAELGTELRAVMRSAVESLVALVQPPRPGILIYLECDPEVAANRLTGRGTPAGPEHVGFLGRLQEAYDDLLRGRTDVERIKADRPVDEVAADVRALVLR